MQDRGERRMCGKMKIGMGLIIFLIFWAVFQTAYAESREIRIGATVSATGKFATEVGPFKKLLDGLGRENK